jgi:hypothetical protein
MSCASCLLLSHDAGCLPDEGARAHYGPASVLWMQQLVLGAQRRISVWLPLMTPHQTPHVFCENLVWGCQLAPTIPWTGTQGLSACLVAVEQVSKPHPRMRL